MPDLHPYQVRGVEWIRATAARFGACVLADEMGVGKTPQAIMAPPADAPVLACVPALLKSQTAERIIQWRGTRTPVEIAEGLGALRMPRPGEWVVMNPDILPATPGEVERARVAVEDARLAADGMLDLDLGRTHAAKRAASKAQALGARGTIDRDAVLPGTWLIVDEAHEHNTHATAQTERLRALVRAVRRRGGVVLPLTATPLVNDPGDLRGFLATWGLSRAAWPDARSGKKFDRFAYLRAWGGGVGWHGHEEWGGEPRDAEIAAAMRPIMLRRQFTDVVKIPPMLPTVRTLVDLDAGILELADHADEAIRARAGQFERGAKIVFEECSKLRAALAVAKIPAGHAWCDRMEAAGEPWVYACVSADAIREIGSRPGAARIDGSQSAESRAETVRRFARGELRGVALTHAAGGVGIDLQTAARICVASREWNPARNRQTLARVRRQGQTRPVELTMLLGAHGIESRLDELMEQRRRYMRAIDAVAVPAEEAA